MQYSTRITRNTGGYGSQEVLWNHSETVLSHKAGPVFGNRPRTQDAGLSEVKGTYKLAVPAMSKSSARPRDPFPQDGQGSPCSLFVSRWIFQVRIISELSKDFKPFLKGQGLWAEGVPVNHAERLDVRRRKWMVPDCTWRPGVCWGEMGRLYMNDNCPLLLPYFCTVCRKGREYEEKGGDVKFASHSSFLSWEIEHPGTTGTQSRPGALGSASRWVSLLLDTLCRHLSSCSLRWWQGWRRYLWPRLSLWFCTSHCSRPVCTRHLKEPSNVFASEQLTESSVSGLQEGKHAYKYIYIRTSDPPGIGCRTPVDTHIWGYSCSSYKMAPYLHIT